MEGLGVLAQIGELTRRGEAFALATVVWRQGPSSSKLGSRAIITRDGKLDGWIGGACAEPVVIREAREVLATGQPRLLLLGPADHAVQAGVTFAPISCQSEGAMQVYIEPVLPAPQLVIIGDSPMTRTLAAFAGALGWQTETGLAAADELSINEHSMVVVATQGHGDEEALERAIQARPAYLGLVGSRRRGAAVLGYLAERGVPRDELDRVRVPAGLDLGRTTHAEIAVAIVAELVQLRASGALARSRKSEAGGLAIDPVCGMTVVADASSHPLSIAEATYYFCGTKCHMSFREIKNLRIKEFTERMSDADPERV